MNPTDREQLLLLNQSHKQMLEQIKNYQEENNTQHKEIKELLMEFRNEMKDTLDKKADKNTQWAEPLLRRLGAIIGIGLLGTIGGLIIQGIIHFN